MRNKARFWAWLCIISLMVLFIVSACNRPEETIYVEGGQITGATGVDPGIKAYLGIPFAAPPLGALRWTAPQPVEPWREIRTADTFPAPCIQDLPRSRLPWTEAFMHQGETSEDCLYLNVWTEDPDSKESRPVMVYLYGGGFSEGSNAVSIYNGEALAQKGVVIVGVNYRLGPLGFLAHPELTAESDYQASGNYGLLDQLAALRWVQENIRVFGGDPDRVTIFGQSAGAMSVAMLMQSPLAKGLFERAIIQSGPGLFSSDFLSGGNSLQAAEEAGMRFAQSKGAPSLAELRNLTAEKLIADTPGVRFGPVTDGYFISGVTQSQVMVINGFTADDMGAGGIMGPDPPATSQSYETEAVERFGSMAPAFLDLYPPDSDANVPKLRKESARDRARVSMFLWASGQAQKSEKVYTYYFDRAIPWPEHPEFGAFHSGELPYVFKNLRLLDRPWEAVDHQVTETVSSYWTRFAKTGDPNGTRLPRWLPFDSSKEVTMALGSQMRDIPIASPEKTAFWKKILIRP